MVFTPYLRISLFSLFSFFQMARILSGFRDSDMFEQREDGWVYTRNKSGTYKGAILSGIRMEEWLEMADKPLSPSQKAFHIFTTYWGSKPTRSQTPPKKQASSNQIVESSQSTNTQICVCGGIDTEDEEHICTQDIDGAYNDWLGWWNERYGWYYETPSIGDMYDCKIPVKNTKKASRKSSNKKEKKFIPKSTKVVKICELPETPQQAKLSVDWLELVERIWYDGPIWYELRVPDSNYLGLYSYRDQESIYRRFLGLIDRSTHPTEQDILKEWNRSKAQILKDYKQLSFPTGRLFTRYFDYDIYSDDDWNGWDDRIEWHF